MRRRGDLTDDADPRHLAVALVAAHQGGTLLTHATGTTEPFIATVNAAVDRLALVSPSGKGRTPRSASAAQEQAFNFTSFGKVQQYQFSV